MILTRFIGHGKQRHLENIQANYNKNLQQKRKNYTFKRENRKLLENSRKLVQHKLVRSSFEPELVLSNNSKNEKDNWRNFLS